jgi:membrane-bound metal-dependent hydrolase YbcI (DUF457 family)
MFIGHFALGFAAKRVAPRVSLAILFAAAQFADLLWPILVALGVEQVRIDPGNTAFTPLDFVSYPYSHSLLLLVMWGAVLAFMYRAATGTAGPALVIIAGLVVSHWVLDALTHRPDMPLYPGSAKVGLGLWNSVMGTVVVEVLIYCAGLWMYVRATRALDTTGRGAFAGLAIFLLIAYAAASLGGPPPSVAAIWLIGMIGGAVLVVWSWWVDRHRSPRSAEAGP